MATQEEKRALSNKRFCNLAKDIAAYAAEIIENDKSKYGILLCEGTKDSMDVVLYTEIYPHLVVIPAGGCTNIRKLMPHLRRHSEYPIFGLIDRDNCSKRRIRILERTEDIYCTKLPFIENIICCPEVLKIITKAYGVDYFKVLREVRNDLASLLVDKMSLLNPFNIDLPADKEVQLISITIVTKSNAIHKTIDLSNVMYTFRDKAIVGKVADAMDFHGKEAYYRAIKQQLQGEHRDKLLFAMSKYLPSIHVEEY